MVDAVTESLPERAKRFYERVSTERAAALVELPRLYAADVHFQNPVVDERGLAKFTRTWQHALTEYRLFEFEDITVVGDDRMFTMTYSMNIRFAIGPVFRTPMTTVSYGEGGKIVHTIDYFDVVGSLLAPFPLLDWGYKKIFGLLVA